MDKDKLIHIAEGFEKWYWDMLDGIIRTIIILSVVILVYFGTINYLKVPMGVKFGLYFFLSIAINNFMQKYMRFHFRYLIQKKFEEHEKNKSK